MFFSSVTLAHIITLVFMQLTLRVRLHSETWPKRTRKDGRATDEDHRLPARSLHLQQRGSAEASLLLTNPQQDCRASDLEQGRPTVHDGSGQVRRRHFRAGCDSKLYLKSVAFLNCQSPRCCLLVHRCRLRFCFFFC